jgi:cytochrome b6-f complex iron-sulfur subunit
MAEEKKKLSVAEILAAARKQDGKGAAEAAPPAETAAPQAAAPPADAAPAASAEATPAKPAAAKPAAPKAGGPRLSVAEMMAAARGEKQGGGAAKPATASPAAKPAPAAKKESPKPAAAKPAAGAAVSSEPKDTGSILAAARTGVKPGPMSKAEAAIKAPAAVAARPEKPKLVVPPMPVKPDYAKPKPKAEVDDSRRGFMLGMMLGSFLGIGMTSLATTLGLWTLGTARFMYPNVLTEPPSKFKVGFPSNFAPGQVETKFIPQFGVWVVNYEYNGVPQIYALRSVCTHLGCTPNWLEGEQKFKCPCHGSGFYKDGVNFEGPAPRPLERYGIRLADDGQIEIDKSKLFQEEIGQWNDPASYVPV